VSEKHDPLQCYNLVTQAAASSGSSESPKSMRVIASESALREPDALVVVRVPVGIPERGRISA